MLRKSNYIKVNKQRYLLLEAVLNYCLFVLIGFFFAWGQPTTLTGTPGKESVIHENFSCFLSQHLFNSSHYPFRPPLESVPPQNEAEDSDENELKDNFDDDWNPLIWKHSTEGIFNIFSSVSGRSFQIIQSLHCRSTVPLFILYHSWKSFLR